MNLSAVNRSVILLTRLFDRSRSTQPFLPQTTGKPVFSAAESSLPHSTPEKMGVSPAHLAAFLKELREHPQLRMHSVLILRHGQVICEADFGAQDHRLPRYTFSACKSIVSLAIGILCDKGLIRTSDKLIDLFPDRINAVSRLRMSSLTVEHLLTMRSGIIFNELESQTDEDWIKRFLGSGFSAEPGQQFQYNSLNTYMLSAIVVQKSGMSLTAFLKKHLFDAMDIRDFYWETCPRGNEIGGWGLYMRPEDLCKLGLLVMQNGKWNGTQLISEDYLRRAVSAQVKTPPTTGRYDYGYQIWVGAEPRAFLFNGMFGQNVLGFPDTDMLIVSTAANDELFQQGPFYDLATAYLGDPSKLSDTPLPFSAENTASLTLEQTLCADHTAKELRAAEQAHPKTPAALTARTLLSQLGDILFRPAAVKKQKAAAALPPSAARFIGLTFTPGEQEQTASVGLFPVVMSTVQRNFSRGLVSLSFSKAVENGEERFLVTYREADDTHIFTAGIGHAAQTVLYFHGVPFIAAAKVTFPTDEEGRPVCRLQIDFPETPSSRIIKLFLNRDGTAVLRQEETPGAALVSRTVIGWKSNLAMQPIIGGALDKIDNEYLSYRIRRTLAPEVELQQQPSEQHI